MKILKKIGKKIKKLKNLLPVRFLSKKGLRDAEKEKKKILVPNYVPTLAGQENSEKNNKKIQKIRKPLSGIIFSQNRM